MTGATGLLLLLLGLTYVAEVGLWAYHKLSRNPQALFA